VPLFVFFSFYVYRLVWCSFAVPSVIVVCYRVRDVVYCFDLLCGAGTLLLVVCCF